MKKRRNAILLVILLIMVTSGIMYAAVTGKSLTITGNMHALANDANFDVKFVAMETEDAVEVNDNAYFVDGKNAGEVATISADGYSVTFDMVFPNSGTARYVIFKIKNFSESLNANVTVTATNKSEHFDDYFALNEIGFGDVARLNGNLDIDDSDTSVVIPADGGVSYVKVPVTLIKDVVNDIGYTENAFNNTYSVTLTLSATPEEA